MTLNLLIHGLFKAVTSNSVTNVRDIVQVDVVPRGAVTFGRTVSQLANKLAAVLGVVLEYTGWILLFIGISALSVLQTQLPMAIGADVKDGLHRQLDCESRLDLYGIFPHMEGLVLRIDANLEGASEGVQYVAELTIQHEIQAILVLFCTFRSV